MLYKYEATTPEGEVKTGSVEAATKEIAINSLQRRNLIITSISEIKKYASFGEYFSLFQKIKTRDIVILSRQLSTLFEARVPILTALQLLAGEVENPVLRGKLTELTDDIRSGSSISEAMSKQPAVFSKFYVSMVHSGEEAGKLDEVFSYLAAHLERSYELTSKAKSALIYPAFVIVAFFAVMILMMVLVIPKLSSILLETGQQLPFYTMVIINTSEFLKNYGVFLLVGLVFLVIFIWYYRRTARGKIVLSRMQISLPYLGNLFKKIYLSRMLDNLETLLSSGVSAVRALELTTEVVDNEVYRSIISESVSAIKNGSSISEAFSRYEDMPNLVIQMIHVGEESGKLTFVLKTLSNFYRKEVNTAIETLMSLIEPALIILLGFGVGILVAGIMGPIYNISAGM